MGNLSIGYKLYDNTLNKDLLETGNSVM